MRQDLRGSEIKFSVLAPADMVSYNKDPSKMRSLSRRKGMRNFKVVPAKMVEDLKQTMI
jgi:hypothetical protein